ncbi:MAG: peptidoglycan-binding domain-containing protein, partial [Myxococcota bacterium]
TASKTPIRAVDVAADPIALTEIHERAPAAAAATAPEPLSSPGLIAGDELDRRLAQADPALGTAAALDAVLDAWGLAPAGAGSLTLDAAVVELQARGLAVYSADGADAGSLAGLGPLALVALRGPGGVDHAVLLDRVGVESVRVVGLLGDPTPVEVTREGFDTRVSGQARVVWRDFEGLPPVLRWGYRGPAVEWLQTSLRALGYLKTPATGEYDGATVAAVRAFQITRGLQADGEVGPRTKMALYTALATYPFPRLVQQGEVG